MYFSEKLWYYKTMDKESRRYLDHFLKIEERLEHGYQSGTVADPELQDVYNKSRDALSLHYKLRTEFLQKCKLRYK